MMGIWARQTCQNKTWDLNLSFKKYCTYSHVGMEVLIQISPRFENLPPISTQNNPKELTSNLFFNFLSRIQPVLKKKLESEYESGKNRNDFVLSG